MRPHPQPGRPVLPQHLEVHTSLSAEQAARLYERAERYYDSFRGMWQTGPETVRPSRPGLLEQLHGKLEPETLFWDLHTLDRYEADDSQRALFQAFSSCEAEGRTAGLEVIPRALCELKGCKPTGRFRSGS